MKNVFVYIFLLVTFALGADNIVIQNRVLTRINNNTLSIMDLTKKMDMVFVREYPLYADSVEARFQFYNTNWRTFLTEMIDEQLILASAKDLKVTVSDGEVRQEIEDTLGPDVIPRIDQMNLTYQEVFKMVQNDLIVRRMSFAMVHAKATAQVSPQKIKTAYEQHCKEHPAEEAWNYQVLTIRSDKKLAAIAACQLLTKAIEQQNLKADEALKKLDGHLADVQMNCSEELHRTAKSLSVSHQSALKNLKKGQHSGIIEQASQKPGETLYRVFFLNDYSPAGVVSLASIEDQLKGRLLQEASIVLSDEWREKLRNRYGFDEAYLAMMVPENFEPFSLKR